MPRVEPDLDHRGVLGFLHERLDPVHEEALAGTPLAEDPDRQRRLDRRRSPEEGEGSRLVVDAELILPCRRVRDEYRRRLRRGDTWALEERLVPDEGVVLDVV